MRTQITLRLSSAELGVLDAAARRLHLDRAALLRAASLGVADLVLETAQPLVLAVEPRALLERMAQRLRAPAAREAGRRGRGPGPGGRSR